MRFRLRSSVGRFLSVAVIIGTAMLLGGSAAEAITITLNDGGIHNISSPVIGVDSYNVYNNISSPHDPTTANFFYGSEDFTLFVGVFDESEVNFYSADLSGFRSNDYSVANYYGGITNTSARVLGHSKLSMYGGFIDTATGNSLVMYGGTIGNFATFNEAVFYGGEVGQFLPGGATKIYGGLFDLEGGPTGTLEIFGGTVMLGEPLTGGNTTLWGRNFNIPFGTYTASNNLTYLTGTLRDGSSIEWNKTSIISAGTLTLRQVPEPSTLLLLGSGLLGLVGLNRRRKA